VQGLNDAELRSQCDEISKTIWRLTTALAAGCLFCCVMLASPDATLVSADAKITIPIASLVISYSDFLLLAPVFLIGMTLYLHVFIEQLIRLRLSRGQLASSPASAALLFNLGRPSAKILSAFLFYGLLPCTLAFFVWKAIPRPVAPWILMLLLLATCSMMLALTIRRATAADDGSLVRPSSGLWVLFGASVLAFVLVAVALFVALFSARNPASALLRIRRLELFGAQLDKKDLNNFYAPYADLRKANLQEADLEGADLSHADLRKADLNSANLTGVDLTGARLEGAKLKTARLDAASLKDLAIDASTEIDEKWRIVSCIASGDLTPGCLGRPDLSWLDLSYANLKGANLAGAELTGVDLRFADLNGADLSGTILRVADLSNATLPSAVGAVTAGALGSGRAGDKAPAAIMLVNHWTGACLAGPPIAENLNQPSMVYPCGDKKKHLDTWSVRRVPNSAFTLQASTLGGNTCLDTTLDNEVHMWDCAPDSATQEWRIIPVVGQYVWIQKRNISVCLHGADSREGSPTPWLGPCDPIDHHVQWQIVLPEANGALPMAAAAEAARQKRQADLAATARQFSVSPSGAASGYGEFRGEFGELNFRGRPALGARPRPSIGR
jgi:uncharacterized protein YjbI with pentapeptide repeats